jgi:hypothetical protein
MATASSRFEIHFNQGGWRRIFMVDALRTTTAASASGLIKTAGFRRVFFVATARSGLPMGARRMTTYRRAGALFGSDRFFPPSP